MPEAKEKTEPVSRIYTVPLARAWISPRHHRAVRAINMIKEFARKHMKSEEIKIDEELNHLIWERGIRFPPRRVAVKMEKDEDGVVTVSLLGKAELAGGKPEEVKIEGEAPSEPTEEAVVPRPPAELAPAGEGAEVDRDKPRDPRQSNPPPAALRIPFRGRSYPRRDHLSHQRPVP